MGELLLKRGLATACIDLSDGLSTDLAHLCRESGVSAEVDEAALPVHPLAARLEKQRGIELALNGGEDYELLFAAQASVKMPRRLAGVEITQIGRLTRRRQGGPAVMLVRTDGEREALPAGGVGALQKGDSMRLVFIYGMPATGKLTVAQELEKRTGYPVFHNHLVVDLLLSLFEFGGEPFVELREQIWLSVFEQACRNKLPGLIFTFAPESTVRPGFIDRVVETIARGDSEIDFVELVCPVDELKGRLDSPSRLQYQKLSSVTLFEKLHAEGSLDASYMPRPALTVDTSECSPVEAATKIGYTLGLPGSTQS